MLTAIIGRRSVRKFTGDPVADAEVREILEAAMSAPSAMNEQAWHFVVLTGEALARFLSVNANSPKGAPVGILVCGDLSRSRGDYYVQDCSAATQNILLAAHAKGLGSVWTTVFPEAREPIRKFLGLPEEAVPFSFAPIGHPATASAAKNRYDQRKVHYNGW